jgi:hypothetical protein
LNPYRTISETASVQRGLGSLAFEPTDDKRRSRISSDAESPAFKGIKSLKRGDAISNLLAMAGNFALQDG